MEYVAFVLAICLVIALERCIHLYMEYNHYKLEAERYIDELNHQDDYIGELIRDKEDLCNLIKDKEDLYDCDDIDHLRNTFSIWNRRSKT